ncbi:calcium-binding protein [Candidatus Hamiltonella defensa]|uniref:Peptidase C80 n=1 Tax=Candidatus Williamhamiltonella defendens TaxID=138072 RepID=A0AAC9VL50_9ENTR|nr:C80 family cysteine peptidase [Candidatus Hamiltonella defensa]ASV34251.1 peptidase C80 [Candidatus Hamiltonella defensa]MBK4361136.1 calcium-binding protein [Candidatus Hamiltonella defensa]
MPQDQFPSHSFITHSQSESHIRRTKRNTNELVPFVPVKQWKVQPVITRPPLSGGLTRYAGQLIIQLQDDDTVLKAAVNLTEKHPGSVLVQLDKRNNYRVLHGSPNALQGKLRWQVVGHGSRPRALSRSIGTLAGMKPVSLARLLKDFNQKFNQIHGIKMIPNRISLVGCQLMSHKRKNFATQFAREIKRQGIQAEISARTQTLYVSGVGRKFTDNTRSQGATQTAGDTVLLGWNKNGELIQKKHSSAFRLLSPVLDDWSPQNFTDPKIKSEKFRYLVYASSIQDLIFRTGIFSKNKDIKDTFKQSDFISASIMSNDSITGYSVGLILQVPNQNILAAAPHEDIVEPNLDNLVKQFGDQASRIKINLLKKFKELTNGETTLTRTDNTTLLELTRNGLLSNQLFSYPQRVATPDTIINRTFLRNKVLITGRPDVNIYPHYPVTEEIKITGLFLIDHDAPENKNGAQQVSSSESLLSKNINILRESAGNVAKELGIPLKVIKISHHTDDTSGHQRDMTTKMNQNSSIHLSETRRNKKDPGSSLNEKLKRVSVLVNDISSDKWTSFSKNDLKLLMDFFHSPSGELDWKKFYQTSSDPLLYSQFMSQVQSLRQLSETHDQFIRSTGQTALQRIADWEIFVVENMVNWKERIQLYNNLPGFRASIHSCMQTMYIGDGSILAQQKAQKVSLAYLSILSLDDRELRLKLLNQFQIHAGINQQEIFFQIDNNGDKTFVSLINQLKAESAFVAKGSQNIYQFFETLANETQGYYQLRMGQHILTIAKRKIGYEKTNWYVYDANFGEICVTTDNFQKINIPLRTMLIEYLMRLRDVPQKDGLFVFDVYQLNLDKISKFIPFQNFKSFIRCTDVLSEHSLNQKHKSQKNRGRLSVSNTYHAIGKLGQAHQALSWIGSLTFLSHYWRRHYSEKLSESQQQELDFEFKLAMAGLVYDVGSTLLEFGFRKLGSHFVKKLSYQSVQIFASRMKRLQYAAGLKLAKYGGPVLNILSAFFDIYQVNIAATKLKTETDPYIQKDLKVNIAFSSLGAAIGIGSVLALLALTGKMALVAGAMGITLGILTSVGQGIYYAAREVEKIERYTTLTGLQKLRTGWLSFLGAEIDVEVVNRVTKGETEKKAKKNVNEQVKTNFQALLNSDDQIEAVYYSTGPVILEECHYKKLTGTRLLSNMSVQHTLNLQYLGKQNIRDKILPSEALAILSDYKNHDRRKARDRTIYVDLALENSEYKFYNIKGLSPTDDKIVINTDPEPEPATGSDSNGTFFVKKPREPSRWLSQSVSVIETDSLDPIKAAKIYFFLGAGNDEVVGHSEKRNIFDTGDGIKNFKGGNQSDTFIFTGTVLPEKPSVLDGVKGLDFLIANKKPSQENGGYYINLQENFFSFTDSSQKIATLKNIHHIETCSETDDVILGNDQSNTLNGNGGYDKLMGFNGNDTLVAQAGELDGGEGTDFYRILQNTRSDDVTLTIKEENNPEEFSPVFLDYTVNQIISIKRVKQDVFIELRNKNSSITTLTLSDLYIFSTQQQKRTLTTQYIFYTQDGMIFTGLPSDITFNFDNEEPEPLTLIAQYIPNFDKKHLPKTDSEETPFIIQKMSCQHNPGVIDLKDEKKILPDFLKLVPQESGFDDDLQGDDLSNILLSTTGQDRLEGKGGRDIYVVEDRPTGKEVSIDNYDAPETGDPEQDILLLPFSLKEIAITQEEDDVIVSHLDSPAEHVKLRLVNFMLDKTYRHLSVVDKEGGVHTVSINSQNESGLISDQLFPNLRLKNEFNHLNQLRQVTSGFSEIEEVFHVPGDKVLQTVTPVISS